ncbi:MAG: hypothetical protein FJX53_00660 [Alphaproteobacteria bacterium]|nr:hypothetical protein [Alphaproteobacteria bacterium]
MRRAGSILLLCVALAVAAGCGFRPLYDGGRSGETAVNLSDVAIATIPERVGQVLRNALLDRVAPYGEADAPRWLLRVGVDEQRSSYGVQKDATSTRASLRLGARFSLVERSSGQTVLSGTSMSINSFNVLRESFATAAAETDARQRGARELAEDITTRVAAFIAAVRARDPAVVQPAAPAPAPAARP